MNMLRTHTEAMRERATIEALQADLVAEQAAAARLQTELHTAQGELVTLQAEMAYVASRHAKAVDAMRRAQDWRWLCPLAALAATTIMVLLIGLAT